MLSLAEAVVFPEILVLRERVPGELSLPSEDGMKGRAFRFGDCWVEGRSGRTGIIRVVALLIRWFHFL